MPRERKWGNFKTSEPIDAAFENAKSEIEELYDEMDSWRDNMGDSEGLSQTEKFERVEEAADGLGNAKDNLEYVDLSGLNLEPSTVEFIEIRKRGYPRWVRCANATAKIEAIKDFLQNEVDRQVDNLEATEMTDKLEEQIGYLEDAFSDLECIEFPGMF